MDRCNGQKTSQVGVVEEQPNGLRCIPEGEGGGSSRGELAYWCMVHGLVAEPSREEALGLLRGTFWERPVCLSPGLPARRQEHNRVLWLRALQSQVTTTPVVLQIPGTFTPPLGHPRQQYRLVSGWWRDGATPASGDVAGEDYGTVRHAAASVTVPDSIRGPRRCSEHAGDC
ncbi:hypothetical protein NDU88_009058 [Pleurodeles waltl]|uniref:Uncharacterized protein n=1 Tax=Pleurodeles waltl TaxID=8319 RepID=A0AAV7RYN5_PLEWA|nr:hypothetical protein NDU88_009058 [Pleurodeles waltl]